MVANLVNNAYLFSADMEDIRITDVHEKLAFKMTVDGQQALSEVYYPDSGNAVVICNPGDIINEYFAHPELGSGNDWIALPPMTVQLSLSDSEATADYTLYVFHSRYRVSFEPLTGFIFYSRYKIKHIRQNTIDYLSFFVSDKTIVHLDIIYQESGSSVKKTVELQLSDTNRMMAYNMSPVKVGKLANLKVDNILSYDARITDGTLTDL